MTEFTKAKVTAIGKDIMAALEAVEKKHGVKIKRGNGTYNPNNYGFKIEVCRVNEDGDTYTPERHALDVMYPGTYGKKISIGSSIYTVVGYRKRAYKRPILLKDSRGKFVVASIKTVEKQLT